MMTREERLQYWAKIESASSAVLADPEVVAEYVQASHSWDSAITRKPTEDRPAASPGEAGSGGCGGP